MKSPLISVIITSYNYEHYIIEAIESVLQQQYQPFEIIVVDDGSTDLTAEQLENYKDKIQYFYQSNKGVAAALNLGLSKATGEYIAFLDADDIWTPNKLQLQVETLRKHPNIPMIFGHIEHFYSPELSTEERQKLECPTQPQKGFHKNCILVKKDVFQTVGIFDEAFKFSDFIKWFQEVTQANIPFIMLEDTLAKRRIHTNNMTIVHRRENQLEILKILRQKQK